MTDLLVNPSTNLLFDPSQVKPFQIDPNARCNVDDEVFLKNVNINIRRGLPQICPYGDNGLTAILVCGGPSLNLPEVKQELLDAHWRGAKIVAVNGAYKWCIENNLKPSVMIMLDARKFNTRFVDPPVPECKYLLASQCDPEAFEKCRDRETWIWHACSAGESELEMLKKYYFDTLYPITIGTTVSIRALTILSTLGWNRIKVFGLDSCWLEVDGQKSHHAYAQPENSDKLIKVWLRFKDVDREGEHHDEKAQVFYCAPWHIRQAQDFQELVVKRGNKFQLSVHGPGLIATMLRVGAELQIEKEIKDGSAQA